jgi:hypothetical protein
MGRGSFTANQEGAEYTELQAEEWKSVNAELLRQLGACLDQPNPRNILPGVMALNDRFRNNMRLLQTEVAELAQALLQAAVGHDFVKAAVASRKLVILRSRFQATQAAQNELEQTLRKAKVIDDRAPIELSNEVADTHPSYTSATGAVQTQIEKSVEEQEDQANLQKHPQIRDGRISVEDTVRLRAAAASLHSIMEGTYEPKSSADSDDSPAMAKVIPLRKRHS